MGRPIDIQAALTALEKEKPTPFVNKDGSIDPFGAGQQNQWYRDSIAIMNLSSAQLTLYGYDIKHLAFVASIMAKKGVSPEEAVAIFRDVNRVIEMMLEDMKETQEKALEQWEGAKDGIAEEAEKEI